jgi:type IV pilus assembly protein PilV
MKIPVQPRQRGIALLEVLIAIVLLGIGVLGTIGLQARSYSALADTAQRAEATMAAEKLIGTATNDQSNLAAYALNAGGTPSATLLPWYDETRDRIPAAAITVAVVAPSVTAAGTIKITIGWMRKKGSGSTTDAANSSSYTVTSYLAPSMAPTP